MPNVDIRLTVRNTLGMALSGKTVSLSLIALPAGHVGGYSAKPLTGVTNGSGIVTFSSGIPGATYQIWVGSNVDVRTFTVPVGQSETYDVPGFCYREPLPCPT